MHLSVNNSAAVCVCACCVRVCVCACGGGGGGGGGAVFVSRILSSAAKGFWLLPRSIVHRQAFRFSERETTHPTPTHGQVHHINADPFCKRFSTSFRSVYQLLVAVLSVVVSVCVCFSPQRRVYNLPLSLFSVLNSYSD